MSSRAAALAKTTVSWASRAITPSRSCSNSTSKPVAFGLEIGERVAQPLAHPVDGGCEIAELVAEARA